MPPDLTAAHSEQQNPASRGVFLFRRDVDITSGASDDDANDDGASPNACGANAGGADPNGGGASADDASPSGGDASAPVRASSDQPRRPW
ncbi:MULTISPECIES: hypothetical protein [unclassified Bradyrhizobium]|uniref:hypothetical protein n=1 Tax=unclassified Bradyrhizobium TaxID=2631580 RepID=UPI002011FECB|nr:MULTISPECIES: hypothetical protein [unclassified Bradyrhizobium]